MIYAKQAELQQSWETYRTFINRDGSQPQVSVTPAEVRCEYGVYGPRAGGTWNTGTFPPSPRSRGLFSSFVGFTQFQSEPFTAKSQTLPKMQR